MEEIVTSAKLKRLVFGVLLGLVFSIFPFYFGRVLLLSNLPCQLSPYMQGLHVLGFLSPLVAIAAAPAFVFLVVTKAIKKQGLDLFIYVPALVVSAASILAPFFLPNVVDIALHSAARRAARNGTPIVAALEAFHAKQGKYPANLSELVPEYLPQIPETGMVGYPEFRYRLPDPTNKYDEFSGYEIHISMAFPIDFDSLYYWPEGNKRDRFGSAGTIFDKWVFFND